MAVSAQLVIPITFFLSAYQPLALLAALGVFKTFSRWFKNPLILVNRLGHEVKAEALPPRQMLQTFPFGTRL